jgi:ribonuclease HIII
MEVHRSVLSAGIRSRIDEFREYVKSRVVRSAQLDKLGDLASRPETVFEILGDSTEHIPLQDFDASALHSIRIGKPTRAHAAMAMLDRFGVEKLPEQVATELRLAFEDLSAQAAEFQGQALFVNPSGEGLVLGLKVNADNSRRISPFAEIDKEMEHQASVALSGVLGEKGARWDIEWPVEYEGKSIGLGLYVAGLVALHKRPADPLLAATGEIDVNDRVLAVGGVPAKLRAAVTAGMRRIILPEANRAEAEASPDAGFLELLYVQRTSDIFPRLSEVSTQVELGYDGRIRLVRNLLPLYGVEVASEEPREHFHRFVVADAKGKASLDLFRSRASVVGGPQSSAREAVNKLKSEWLDTVHLEQRPPISFKIVSSERQLRLRQLLSEAGAVEVPVGKDEIWRLTLAEGQSRALIILYKTGTCHIPSGQAPAHDTGIRLVEQALEGLGGIGGNMPVPSEPLTSSRPVPNEEEPHIGTDEAGKGDFFGPLVCAAVYVDKDLADSFRSLGVRDSKTLTDKAVRRLAAEIRQAASNRITVTRIQPKRFNELYSQMRQEGKNLNTLLAWGHTRSIEDLLLRRLKPRFVIVDQFADASYIQKKLLADTRESGIPILQHPKAESDIAVAAASILARDSFLDWLEETSRRIGQPLPKGVSLQVIEVGRKLVATRGVDALRDYAKVSFKTMEKVLIK